MHEDMKRQIRSLAGERIKVLLDLAKSYGDPYSDFATGYVKLARKISSHYKISIGNRIPYCKNCNCVLIPGKNASVRVASSKKFVVYKCERCGAEVHVSYKKRSRDAA